MMMMGENVMGSAIANMFNMPFNMGVFIMPMTCTSRNELLGSMSGMFGSADGDSADGGGGGDNATQYDDGYDEATDDVSWRHEWHE